MKLIRALIIAMAIVAVGFIIWWLTTDSNNIDYKTAPARIRSLSRMVELCTTDIHEEIPIKDSINGKWIVARQVVDGRIRFNIENMKIEEKGDTTFVYLPDERVDILENAGPEAYEVLDTWDGKSTLFPRTLSAAEENTLKTRWQQRVRKRIYDHGHVRQARSKAVETLSRLFNTMCMEDGKIVAVVDPTPLGAGL